ncbi:MAG TPA: transketolase C-terminal domain-containing protein [Longimicrobium sp.]|nr:transketolase C-terminal domain-containing protein [Longimicrobium sp.]
MLYRSKSGSDLRTLSPFDMEPIAESVKRTNRMIVAHEDSLSWRIAARIADELFPWLDAPVERVASLDTWVAYAPQGGARHPSRARGRVQRHPRHRGVLIPGDPRRTM